MSQCDRKRQEPTPEEAAAYPYSPVEQAFIDRRQAHQVIGSPATVALGLQALLEQTPESQESVVQAFRSSQSATVVQRVQPSIGVLSQKPPSQLS